jgi:hypothetical protein
MDPLFVEWLQASGFDPEALSAQQIAVLQQAHAAELAAEAETDDGSEETGGQTEPPATQDPPPASASGSQDLVANYRTQMAAETERVERIRQVCAGQHPTIEARAIREGWNADRAELEVLRASRPTGPAIHSHGSQVSARAIEAGLLMAVISDNRPVVRAYGDQVLDQGRRFRRLGFKELMRMCCAMDGRTVPGFGATDAEMVRAAFSTTSLPGILSNVGHKVMLDAYTAVPSLAEKLCRSLNASDFKTHTGYRVSGDMKFEEVGPNGELGHGKLDESGYTYSVKTYGKFFGLTRTMQVNDDLGAFAEVPRLIGRGAALTKERLFWLLVHANTGSFFSEANGNLITKALGSEGLRLAVAALEDQTDDQKDPILVMGKYLVVPTALKATAQEIFRSTNVNTGGASTKEKVPNANIYQGMYEPQSSPYLGNTSFHKSASSLAWYLWGDPADVPAFGLAYLNGVNTPVIEDAPVSGEFLGNAWRGYMDIGVCQIDPAGAVKSTGVTA